MKRFLPRALLAFLFATIAPSLMAERTDTELSTGWLFIKADPAGAAQPDFADSAWSKVSVPHTWNELGEPAPQESKLKYYRGPGWYRRPLEITARAVGRRTFLRFEAASLVADVYLNGTKLGQHRGGFTAFCYEITSLLKPGTNLLAVRVDNAIMDDVSPLEGDFTVFGGLYRPVHVLQTDTLCIDPLPDAAPGVAVFPHDLSTDSAKVRVTTTLSDQRSNPAETAKVRTTVLDADGKTVAQQTSVVPVKAVSAVHEMVVSNPHLWNGIADPYLYSTRVEILAGDKVVDTVTQPLGFRTITFDPKTGATLNGQPYRFKGVCRHQAYGDKGWAINHADQDNDMALIREVGANAVRLAHYPHADYFYSLCDQYGILAWTEVPNVNAINDTPAFTANARQQLRELILQQGNHPAIFAWGLWNEIGHGDEPIRLIAELRDEAHELDPSRPTTAAAFSGSEKKFPELLKVTDLIAHNKYPGWYGNSSSTGADMNKMLDQYKKSVVQPVGISEYGAGASIYQHEQGRTQHPDTKGPWHPEEWQATVHEQAWKAIAQRPFIWGSFVWNMFDFPSAGRDEGDLPHVNDKGLVTQDRKTKKDAFFFYQASWSHEPMLYITSRRDTTRSTAETPVKIYANTESVELKLNGVSLAESQRDGVIYRWPSVKLKAGENVLEATAKTAGKALTDRVVWTYDPNAKPSPFLQKKSSVEKAAE